MSLLAHCAERKAYLAQAGLLPPGTSLIPDDFVPSTRLQIAFGEKQVNLGNLLRASECKAAPTVSFPEEKDVRGSPSYTLLLIDPDAPTPDDRRFAYWRHWVVSGLQPSAVQEDIGEEYAIARTPAVHSKPALTEYLGPGPKDESRPHSYLFLLFREPEGFSLGKEDVGGEEFVDRRSFKAPEWVAEHGLQLVSLNWMLGAGDGWKGD